MNKLLLVSCLLIIIIAVIFTLRFVAGGGEDTWICQNNVWVKHGNPSASVPTTGCGENQPLVGGDRDAHGCIGSAGYSWCEISQKCYRPWEEKCEVNNP